MKVFREDATSLADALQTDPVYLSSGNTNVFAAGADYGSASGAGPESTMTTVFQLMREVTFIGSEVVLVIS